MRFARIGERVRVKNNKNGTYKDMTGIVEEVFPSGTAMVAIDGNYIRTLSELGFSFHPRITAGNYEVITKIGMSTLEVE